MGFHSSPSTNPKRQRGRGRQGTQCFKGHKYWPDTRARKKCVAPQERPIPSLVRRASVGLSNARAGKALAGRPITVQYLLATFYHLLGVDPGTTFLDHLARQQMLLDEQEKIMALL